MRGWVWIVFVVGCGKTEPAMATKDTAPASPPRASAAECAAVGEAAAKRHMQRAMSVSHSDYDKNKELASNKSKALAERCQTDGWSIDAAACAVAKSIDACAPSFSKEQLQKLEVSRSPFDDLAL